LTSWVIPLPGLSPFLSVPRPYCWISWKMDLSIPVVIEPASLFPDIKVSSYPPLVSWSTDLSSTQLVCLPPPARSCFPWTECSLLELEALFFQARLLFFFPQYLLQRPVMLPSLFTDIVLLFFTISPSESRRPPPPPPSRFLGDPPSSETFSRRGAVTKSSPCQGQPAARAIFFLTCS